MLREQFAGATKSSTSFVSPLERRMARAVLPKIPRWLETYHLTWLTLVWCALILLFSRLAASDLRWLWAVSLMIALQYVTDFFDGKLGKFRGTGLVKWGFYMDHLFDYVFLSALILGYSFILPPSATPHLLFLLAVFGGFMINSFLAFSATARFDISLYKFGPTEFRLAVIIINALLVQSGTRRMERALPYVAGGALVGLSLLVYLTQRRLWQSDMEAKEKSARARRSSSP